MEGYIKGWRKILDSDLYKSLTAKQYNVLEVCLRLATFQKRQWEWKGKVFICEPGQFITSIESLRKKCTKDVNAQNIKTALLKLAKWQFLTNESTKSGRLITIVNWRVYQDIENQTNKETNQQLTNNQPTANQQLTTNKNEENEKKEKNVKKLEHARKKNLEKTPGEIAREFFMIPDKQTEVVKMLVEEKGFDVDFVKEEIYSFVRYWTEPTKSGKYLRWEKQPMFEVSRRLQTWFKRARERYSNNSKQSITGVKIS